MAQETRPRRRKLVTYIVGLEAKIADSTRSIHNEAPAQLCQEIEERHKRRM